MVQDQEALLLYLNKPVDLDVNRGFQDQGHGGCHDDELEQGDAYEYEDDEPGQDSGCKGDVYDADEQEQGDDRHECGDARGYDNMGNHDGFGTGSLSNGGDEDKRAGCGLCDRNKKNEKLVPEQGKKIHHLLRELRHAVYLKLGHQQ